MRTLYYFFLALISFPFRIFNNIGFSVIIKKSKIDKKVAIDEHSKIYNSSIGKYTYIGKYSTICNTVIGNFCSIADNCISSPGKHQINMVSSSPVFYSKKNIFRICFNRCEFKEYDDTIIGNDVWIGSHVFIKGGVKIGNGAIIGAYSIVTKDIESYSIVVGNPAREIRKRFVNEEVIQKIQNSQWWYWEDKELTEKGYLFENVNEFIKMFDK